MLHYIFCGFLLTERCQDNWYQHQDKQKNEVKPTEIAEASSRMPSSRENTESTTETGIKCRLWDSMSDLMRSTKNTSHEKKLTC